MTEIIITDPKDLDRIESAGRLAQFAFRQLQAGLPQVGADEAQLASAMSRLGAAESHLMRAQHELAVVSIRAEVRRRFPEAVAIELNLMGRSPSTVTYVPRRIVDAGGQTLWGYREAYDFADDSRPLWEVELEGCCESLNLVDNVPVDVPVMDPAICV